VSSFERLLADRPKPLLLIQQVLEAWIRNLLLAAEMSELQFLEAFPLALLVLTNDLGELLPCFLDGVIFL